MMNLDLIDKYFENSLTAKERLEFNELIQSSEEFKKEFLFQKDLKKAISKHQNLELKETLAKFESDLHKSSLFSVVPFKWMAAASLVLLLSVGTWMVRNYVFPSNEQIFETYFEPYQNTIVPIVRGTGVNTIEYRAFVAYESGEYHKAINLFNSTENANEKYIRFYKAMCYISVNKTKEAIETLLPLADDSSNQLVDMDWRQKAEWYIGLSYLKQGKEQEARYYFDKLKNQDQELRFKQKESKKISGLLR